MKEVNMNELTNLLGQALGEGTMEAGEIVLLRENFVFPRQLRRAIPMKKIEDVQRKFYSLGLPEGKLSLPVQYATGHYYLKEGEEIAQHLATVFHPDFFDGKTPYQENQILRPLEDGYLDTRDQHILRDVADNEFANNYRVGLWIGGVGVNNPEGLVSEHIRQFSRLYKMKQFLKQPERDLIDKAFQKK